MTEKTAEDWIATLELEQHPEGGYYRRVYAAAEEIPGAALPARFGGAPRLAGSAIYYLVTGGRPSRLHRIKSDELWHFYAGAPLRLSLFPPEGEPHSRLLGAEPDRNQQFQRTVPHGWWFAAESEGAYSLCGCTVAPGFAFEDLELAGREELFAAYPQHRNWIERLT